LHTSNYIEGGPRGLGVEPPVRVCGKLAPGTLPIAKAFPEMPDFCKCLRQYYFKEGEKCTT